MARQFRLAGAPCAACENAAECLKADWDDAWGSDMGERNDSAGREVVRGAVLAALPFFLYAVLNWLLTNKVFPVATTAAPLCRDIGTAAQALGYLAVSTAALRRPGALRPFLLVGVPICLTVVGAAVLLAAGDSPLGATFAVCCLEVAAVAVTLSAGCALSRLDEGLIVPCVLVSLLASYLLRLPLADMQGVPMVVAFVLVQVGVVVLSRPALGETLSILQRGETPEELTVTNPFSFLPRTHQLFVCLLLFQTAYGMALGFGEVDSVPLATFAGMVPLACVCALLAVRRAAPRLDTVLACALLLVMAGFLFAPLALRGADALTSNLLEAGSSCFMLVFWATLATLARRNRTGAPPLFSWAGFLMSLGVVLGAGLGRVCYAAMSASPDACTVVVGVSVLTLAAYAVLVLRRFSFDETVRSLQGTSQVAVREAAPDVQVVTEKLAARHGLTPREAEIFGLLAQGRNGAYIQRQLGASYNTVKTHVAHIYTKLGVHAHQELIDLVERECMVS